MPNKYIMVLPVAVGEKQLSIKNVASFKSKYFSEVWFLTFYGKNSKQYFHKDGAFHLICQLKYCKLILYIICVLLDISKMYYCNTDCHIKPKWNDSEQNIFKWSFTDLFF